MIVGLDQNACREYERAGADWRHGREDLTALGGFDSGMAWHCPKASREVAAISSKEHTIAEQLCASGHCEHGNKRSLDMADQLGRDPSPQVVRFFRTYPELESVPACTWLDHHKAAQSKTVITVTAAGLGSGDLKMADGRDRLVIVDESVQWTHTQRVGLDQITQWLKALEQDINTLRGTQYPTREEQIEASKLLELCEAVLPVYRFIAAKLGALASTQGRCVDAKEIGETIVRTLSGSRKTEKWERIRWDGLLIEEAPLRAAHEILRSAKDGSLSVVDGKLLVHYLHVGVAEALGQQPLLVADATLSHDWTGKAAIIETGGEIVRVIAAQPMVTIDPRRFNGAVPHGAEDREDRLQTEARAILATRDSKKDLNSMARDDLWNLSIQRGIGWWGWHDAAHDEWNSSDLLIWDEPAIPRDVLRDKWEAHRAFLISQGADPKTLPHMHLPDPSDPEYKDYWVKGEWVTVGGYDQQSQAAMYSHPLIRAFIQDCLDTSRLQAIGRARGVNNPNVKVYICGGYPVAALAKHGIEAQFGRVAQWETRQEAQARHTHEADQAMASATLAIVGRGKATVTRDALMAEIRATGTYGKTTQSICPTTDKAFNGGGANDLPVSGQSPRKDRVGGWLERVAPVIAGHLSKVGRNGKLVAALQESIRAAGPRSIKAAEYWLKRAEKQWLACGDDAAAMVDWAIDDWLASSQCGATKARGAVAFALAAVFRPPSPS